MNRVISAVGIPAPMGLHSQTIASSGFCSPWLFEVDASACRPAPR
ncbi:hypothetical protein [Ottowia thiooxydans]|uniref:Uncharacterized protein n=1 Tax=Ottowia thiooxydans TaxID=219182 RepID=A0ABV2Q9Q7_9BURK